MPAQPARLVVPVAEQAAVPGALNLTLETMELSDILRVDTLGSRMAQATIRQLGSKIYTMTAPVPLSMFFNDTDRTTPEAALAYAISEGFRAVALDSAYTWTGTTTINVTRFCLFGSSIQQRKEFNGNLFEFGAASRWSTTVDLDVLANGGTYSGDILSDSGGGNPFIQNCNCLDIHATSSFYAEAAGGAFNRGVFVGGSIVSVNPLNAVIKMNPDVDPSEQITGNGVIYATRSPGVLLHCGSAQELKVYGVTSEMPYLGRSRKTAFIGARLVRRDGESIIKVGDEGTSNFTSFVDLNFSSPTEIYAPKVRLTGILFSSTVLADCNVLEWTGGACTSGLSYGPNWSGATFEPNGTKVVAPTNPAQFNAADGLVFTISARQDIALDPPENPSPGQRVVVQFTAINGDRTLSLTAGAGGFDPGAFSLTLTPQNTTDNLEFIYSRAADVWQLVAYNKGYSITPLYNGPNYLNSGPFMSQAAAANIVIDLPGPIVVGALLIASVTSLDNTSHTYPAGWTKVDQDNSGASWTESWAWRIADGTEGATLTVAIGGLGRQSGIVIQYTGVNAVPIGNTSVGTGIAVTTRDIPSVNTTANNSTVIYLIRASTGGSKSDADPGGSWIERFDLGASPAAHATLGDQYVAVSGSASGAIALTGSISATYVARQIEIMSA